MARWWRQWRWWWRRDGRWDTMTMAADDDDNEVNGNSTTGNDDGYVSYFNIVNLIMLLICLQFFFYRRRLLLPGERTPQGMGWREAGEHSRGREDSSPVCCSRLVLLTPWFSPSLCRHNWLSCEGFRVPQGTEDEFWQGIDQNRPTKFPTTAFSDKSHSNSKNVKTKINKMMGWIENGP